MEGACSKRKPATQLTKDNVEQLDSGREPSADADAAQELKEADPETLKNRRYAFTEDICTYKASCRAVHDSKKQLAMLLISCCCARAAAAQAPEDRADAWTACERSGRAAEVGREGGPAKSERISQHICFFDFTLPTQRFYIGALSSLICPQADTTATAPEEKEAPASAAAAAEGASPTAEAAPVTAADESKSEAAAAAAPVAATHEPAVLNGETAQNSINNSTNNTESGGGLFGSVLKGAPAFVSPFGSLGATGSSFLLPSSGNATGTSLFGDPQGGPPAADAEDAEAQPPEEPTIVATTVDSKEEVIFSDRDCRMQCFDAEHKVWTPKPPLDGKVDFVVPKVKPFAAAAVTAVADAAAAIAVASATVAPLAVARLAAAAAAGFHKGEEEGLPIARLLFFVNRTGRLRLNSPVLPSSVRFRHPAERAAAKPAAAAGAAAAAAAAGPDTDASAKEKKDVPLKLNTVEFTGLKIDAKDSKDTTFYRIRFSSDERAKEFMALANAKQEEATKAAQNGSN
ncbi:hypothetical protein Emag_006110 [Eimeria magna]